MTNFSETDEEIRFAPLRLVAGESCCAVDVHAPGGFLAFQDDFLNTEAARADAMASSFIDWAAPDGEVYRRICFKEVPGLQQAIERVVGPVDMVMQGYRLNFAGEMPNHAVHSDIGLGGFAAVVYLCDGIGGTAFWRHRKTGATQLRPGDFDLFNAVRGDWDDQDAWERVAMVGLALGRGVIYSGSLFHSRFPFEGFGAAPDDGRLIAVAFFSPRARA